MRRRTLWRAMSWDGDLADDLVERMWRDPHALLAAGVTLQDKPRCTVVRIDHPAGPFVLKCHNWGSFGRTLKKSLNTSPAEKTWTDGRLLHAAGIPTPQVRAYAERRFGPFRSCSCVLTDFVPGTTLYRLMRFEQPAAEVVHDLARQVAAIWQQLDQLSVSHNDLKTENFMVDRHGRVWLIDLEKMRRCPSRNRLRRKQARDAGVFLHPRNWRANPQAAEVFRQAILRTPAAIEATAGPAVASHPLSQPIAGVNRPSQLVTVLVPCRNHADMISGCLESVRDIADEILVADAGSTDETLDIVRKWGDCRVVARQAADDAEFENWALAHARHPWILRILPQERLHAELGKQVQDLLATDPAEHGFSIARRHFFWRRPLRFGGFQDEAPVRLYRKGAAHNEWREGRVEVVVPSGKVGRISSPLSFDACASVEQYTRDALGASARAAVASMRQGRRPARSRVLWHVPWRFVRSYVLRGGFLDGWRGLHAACLSAVAVCLREVQLWEASTAGTAAPPVPAARDEQPCLKLFDPASMADAAAAPVAADGSRAGALPTAGTGIPHERSVA